MNEIMKELEKLMDDVVFRCMDIMDDPSKVSDKLQRTIEAEGLTDEQLFDIENYLDELENNSADYDYTVESYDGKYRDEDGFWCHTDVRRIVWHEELVDSFEYDGHVLDFEVPFQIINYWDAGEWEYEVSDETWEERMKTFREADEDEEDEEEEEEEEELYAKWMTYIEMKGGAS